jgi:hypothetical protein
MPKQSDHEHVPSKILNRKLNWIIVIQLALFLSLAALYLLLR